MSRDHGGKQEVVSVSKRSLRAVESPDILLLYHASGYKARKSAQSCLRLNSSKGLIPVEICNAGFLALH